MMELKRLLTRSTALLSQGSYQGAESFIERAMAEAMPVPKQEPVGSVKKWIDSNTAIVSGERMAEIYGEEKLYSAPQPAQAAAIPDEPTGDMISAGIEAMNRGLGLFGDNHAQIVNNVWEDMYAEALSASPKPE